MISNLDLKGVNRICFKCMRKKERNGGFCGYCGFNNEEYEVPVNDLLPLTLLKNKYLLGKSIGSGGFGITYIALDTDLGVKVAIKELFSRQICKRAHDVSQTVSTTEEKNQKYFNENKERLLHEAKILANLNEKEKDSIVQVKEVFEENNTAYMVMEYINGETLKSVVKDKPLNFRQMYNIMEPICQVLQTIHHNKLVHLDVSPDNIMIPENRKAKLLDFGGAKEIGSQDSSDQYIFKKGYAPLEQRTINGNVGEWTDIYAFAATMYFCITGTHPLDVNERIAGAELNRPSELDVIIPRKSEDAMMKALRINPEDRYQTMEEFWEAFKWDARMDVVLIAAMIGAILVLLIMIISLTF